ncbi:MAG TPA: alpha/beta family hydrolase [Pseudomonadales bacterium]
MTATALEIPFGTDRLAAELVRPPEPIALLVLAHGAGAGYRHASLVAIGDALGARGIATLRWNFPYMQAGRRRVDSRATAVAAVRAAAELAASLAPELPLYLGGHSFGGRMASHAVADGAVIPRGLVCLSFPLHPAGRPGTARADHLDAIRVPMLFLSGTRDALAERALLTGVVARLGARARLHWLDDADHGYRVRKRERRDPRGVFDEIADETEAFVRHGESGGSGT